jgi:hypothetical protein
MYRKRVKEYYDSGHSERLEAFSGIHKGERCFIIGNGPSLNIPDLEMLRNEITFTVNRIYQFFDETTWRPTYWTCKDPAVLLDICEELDSLKGTQCFVNYVAEHMGVRVDNNFFYIFERIPFEINRYHQRHNILFSGNISKMIEYGETITYAAIQIAAYMGFAEIYLMGVDNNYSTTLQSDGQVVVDETVKNYPEKLMPKNTIESKYAKFAIEPVTRAYAAAKDYCEAHNIRIANATRGGKLEVFERVNLEDILAQPKPNEIEAPQ